MFPQYRIFEQAGGYWQVSDSLLNLAAHPGKMLEMLADWLPGISAEPGSLAPPAGFPAGLRFRKLGDGELRQGNGQGFQLQIEAGGVLVEAANAAGFRHALIALLEMVADTEQLPICRIEDWPAFPTRGFMLDISRDRVPKVAALKSIIDLLALTRYNHLELYAEHTFAYKGHETVWAQASPYTAEEIVTIRDYAARRGIELVPCQNSYGHMNRWLKHPAYKVLAECPDGFTDHFGLFQQEPTTLDPLDPRSIELIAGLYAQLLPLFPAGMVNIGGDEPWEHCQGKSSEHCAQRGKGQVYLDFILKLHELTTGHGKQALMWGDIVTKYPELIPDIPADMVLLEWGYGAEHPFAERGQEYHRHGIPYWVCPGTSSWSSIGGHWQNCCLNIMKAAREGLAEGAEGFLLTDWGDRGHHQQSIISWPGIVYGGAASWNPQGVTDKPEQAEPLLAEWIDRHTAPGIGQALISLNSLSGKFGAVGGINTTDFLLLFDRISHGIDYPKTRPQWENCPWTEMVEEVAAIARKVRGHRPEKESETVSRLREELLFTCKFMQHSFRYAAAATESDQLSASNDRPFIDPTMFAEDVRSELRAEFSEIIDEYRRLWQLQARPGGMPDSMGSMEDILKSY